MEWLGPEQPPDQAIEEILLGGRCMNTRKSECISYLYV